MMIFRALLLTFLFTAMVLPPIVSAEPINGATTYLPTDEEIPPGFQHDVEHDNFISLPNVERAFRVYLRGDQPGPLESRSTLMVSAAVSDTVESAMSEFQIAQRGWSTTSSYEFEPLNLALGDEAIVGHATLAADTSYPKAGTLILFRLGALNGAVQLTDDLDRPSFDQALALAQIIEAHAYQG
jgi:hypothetical protein